MITQILFLITLFFSSIYLQSDCGIKKAILKEMVKDQSIKVFFKNKSGFLVEDKSGIFFLESKYFEIQENTFMTPPISVEDTLTIVQVEQKPYDRLFIQVLLFSRNTIYSAEFKTIDSNKVKLEKSSLTQIRQP